MEAAISDRRRSLARRIVSSVSLNSMTSVATMVLSGLASIVVARATGPDGLAEFVFVNMVIFVTDSICTFSMPLAVAKRIAIESEHGDQLAVASLTSTTASLMATIAGTSGLAVALGMPVLENQFGITINPAFRVALPLILILSAVGNAAWGTYLGLLRQGRGMAIVVSGPVAMVAYLTIWYIGAPLPLWGAPAVAFLVPGLVSIPLLLIDRLIGHAASRHLRNLLRDSVPAASFTFLIVASTWSDRAVVGVILGATPMGLYTAASAIVQAALRIPTNLSYVFVPAGTHAGSTQIDRLQRLNEMEVKSLAIFSSFLVSLVIVGAPEIVPTLFGQGFEGAVMPTVIMTPVLLMAAVTIPVVSALMVSRKPSTVVRLLLITFPIRIGLLIGFTSWMGLPGTAVGTVAAELVLAAFAFWYARPTGINIPLAKMVSELPRAGLATAGGLGLSVLTDVPLLGVVFVLLLFTPRLWRFAKEVLEVIRV